jgi:hypothetical protein
MPDSRCRNVDATLAEGWRPRKCSASHWQKKGGFCSASVSGQRQASGFLFASPSPRTRLWCPASRAGLGQLSSAPARDLRDRSRYCLRPAGLPGGNIAAALQSGCRDVVSQFADARVQKIDKRRCKIRLALPRRRAGAPRCAGSRLSRAADQCLAGSGHAISRLYAPHAEGEAPNLCAVSIAPDDLILGNVEWLQKTFRDLPVFAGVRLFRRPLEVWSAVPLAPGR